MCWSAGARPVLRRPRPCRSLPPATRAPALRRGAPDRAVYSLERRGVARRPRALRSLGRKLHLGLPFGNPRVIGRDDQRAVRPWRRRGQANFHRRVPPRANTYTEPSVTSASRVRLAETSYMPTSWLAV